MMGVLPFVCPRCHGSLDESGELAGMVSCRACATTYERRDRIYRFLVAEEIDALQRFHAQYVAVRARDGSRIEAPDRRRQLPSVGPQHPHAREWQIRRESFSTLRRRALGRLGAGGVVTVADLGAGNGWLSYRLSLLGYVSIAIDRFDDDVDGLGACREYERPFWCAQADFNRLPLPSGTIDVVILNGSLHYSGDPAATLAEARRVLAPGGSLVVMDSPMFADEADGEAMVARQLESFRRDLRVEEAVRGGVGFLTFEGLGQAAAALGLRGRFFPSRGPLGWRMRRALARVRLRKAPAAFGVWVAQ